MKKYVAEAFGTFVLVLVGCGTIVLAGAHVGQLGIALAFGLGLIAAAYTIGGISGCHINPAVTAGAWAAGRMDIGEAVGYVIGQIIGAIVAAFVVLIIAKGKLAGYDIGESGLGQNGFGSGFLGEYNILSAVIFEFIATLIFVVTVMEITEDKAMSRLSGLLIGLVLVGIYIFGFQITGASLNPARSIGPALFAGPYAWAQLPVFIIAPLAGGLVAGYLSKSRMLSADDEKGEGEKAISDIAARIKTLSVQASEKVKAATNKATASAESVQESVMAKSSDTGQSTASSTATTTKAKASGVKKASTKPSGAKSTASRTTRKPAAKK